MESGLPLERPRATPRRRTLWSLLVLLVVALLVILVWLAGRYEAAQVQSRVEHDAAQAVADIRAALARNVQGLQALHFSEPMPDSGRIDAAAFLREHRELMHLEWRDDAMRVLSHADTPYQAPIFARMGRSNVQSEVVSACATARRFNGPAYASSYFVPMPSAKGTK